MEETQEQKYSPLNLGAGQIIFIPISFEAQILYGPSTTIQNSYTW